MYGWEFDFGWSGSKGFLAQVNHLLGGAIIVLLAPHAGLSPWWGVGILTLYAVVKEFWADYDTLALPTFGWLERDTFLGSVVDFVFYEVGAWLAWLALHGHWWVWLATVIAVAVLLALTVVDYLFPDSLNSALLRHSPNHSSRVSARD